MALPVTAVLHTFGVAHPWLETIYALCCVAFHPLREQLMMTISSPRSTIILATLCVSALLAGGCSKREPIVFHLDRIAADGSAYSEADAAAGEPWVCSRDQRTNLMWEIKSTEPGLHDTKNTYTWHFPPESEIYSRGDVGKPNGGQCAGSECDTWAYLNQVNEEGLCGYKDWRIPTRDELGSLINPQILAPGPTTAHDEFPNVMAEDYWSSSAYAYHSPGAWTWSFYNGLDRVDLKVNAKHVRVVRGVASITPAPPRGPQNQG